MGQEIVHAIWMGVFIALGFVLTLVAGWALYWAFFLSLIGVVNVAERLRDRARRRKRRRQCKANGHDWGARTCLHCGAANPDWEKSLSIGERAILRNFINTGKK